MALTVKSKLKTTLGHLITEARTSSHPAEPASKEGDDSTNQDVLIQHEALRRNLRFGTSGSVRFQKTYQGSTSLVEIIVQAGKEKL